MKSLIEIILLLIISSIQTSIQDVSSVCEQISEDAIPLENSFRFVYSGNETEGCTYISIDSATSTLMIGDSRTVGLHLYTGYDDISYIAKGSMGYNWLVNGSSDYNPSDLVACYIEANPNCNIILNLGVNDLSNSTKYVEWITDLSTQFPEANLYYLSVNPVLGRPDLDVLGFNEYVRAHIPASVKWLDSYSYLEKVGFNAVDGVHYDKATYDHLLQFVIDEVNAIE